MNTLQYIYNIQIIFVARNLLYNQIIWSSVVPFTNMV